MNKSAALFCFRSTFFFDTALDTRMLVPHTHAQANTYFFSLLPLAQPF